jgi:CRISPR-associated protein Csx1
MPALVYAAVERMCGILKYRYDRVGLTILNSEPVTRGVKGLYRINILYKSMDMPRYHINEGIDHTNRLLKPIVGSEYGEELRKLSLEVARRVDRNRINTFIGGIYNGLPLVVSTFKPKPDEIGEILCEAERLYRNETVVEVSEGRVKVTHPLAYTKNFEILGSLYLAASLIDSLVEVEEIDIEHRMTLHDLIRLSRRLYGDDDQRYIMITSEAHVVRRCVDEYVRGGGSLVIPKKYAEIQGSDSGIPDLGRFDRNFLAHSGLERNVTYVSMVKGRGDRFKEVNVWYSLEEEVEAQGARFRAEELIARASTKGLLEARL